MFSIVLTPQEKTKEEEERRPPHIYPFFFQPDMKSFELLPAHLADVAPNTKSRQRLAKLAITAPSPPIKHAAFLDFSAVLHILPLHTHTHRPPTTFLLGF